MLFNSSKSQSFLPDNIRLSRKRPWMQQKEPHGVWHSRPFAAGNHRWPSDSLTKGQEFETLILSWLLSWRLRWKNSRVAGYLRRHDAHVKSPYALARIRYGLVHVLDNDIVEALECDLEMGFFGCWSWRSQPINKRVGQQGKVLTYRTYRQVSNIRRILVGNEIVDHSDVVGASPVGAAPTTSSFSTQHMASTDWVKTTTIWNEKHLSFDIWCVLY